MVFHWFAHSVILLRSLALALSSRSDTNINGVVKMKIISEPLTLSNYVTHSPGNSDDDDDENTSDLIPLVPPSNFTGPEQFRSLIETCFTLQKGNFEYRLCPFQNATQKETAYNVGRSKFHGILGRCSVVWHDWLIQDGRFAGWRFLNGDSCGKKGLRTTEVHFQCGNNNLLWDAVEPEQCRYSLTFKLPQACFPDALLVYPVLSSALRSDWDALEGEKIRGDLTQQGYDKYLHTLLSAAGLIRKNEEMVDDSTITDVTTTDISRTVEKQTSVSVPGVSSEPSARRFEKLDQCQLAFDEIAGKLQEIQSRTATSTLKV